MSSHQFFIKYLTGKTLVLEVSIDEPILKIKEKIFQIDGFPIEKQKLFFQGEVMEDHKVLSYYKYYLEASAHLVIKLN